MSEVAKHPRLRSVWYCRFSDLNLPPKNWTFPCTVATLGEIKVDQLPTNVFFTLNFDTAVLSMMLHQQAWI